MCTQHGHICMIRYMYVDIHICVCISYILCVCMYVVSVPVNGCVYIICRDIDCIFLFIFVAVDVACTVFLHCGQ